MTEMMKTVEHLAEEIGPRPVATEEEQQAALFIEKELEEAGLPVEIEEFQGSVSHKKTRLVCSAVAVVLSIVSLFLPVIALPAIVAVFACAALFMAEELGKPILSKYLDKGISQNVVARYVPPAAQEGRARRRKVVLVARYDSGSVRPEVNPPFLAALPVLAKASRIGMIALPVFLLVKSVFFLHSTGIAFVVTTVLLILICLCAALPAISFIMEKIAGLNNGANSSASGVAVMLEVARRVSGASEHEDAVLAVIHGAEAAYEAGVVPEGAALVYDEGLEPAYDDAGAFAADAALADPASAAFAPAPENMPAPAAADAGASPAFEGIVNQESAVQVQVEQAAATREAQAAGYYGNQAAEAQQAGMPAAAVAVPAAVAAGAAAGFAAGAVASQAANAAAPATALPQQAPAAPLPAAEASAPAPAAGPAPVPAAVAAPAPGETRPVAAEVPSWFSAGVAAARHNEPANARPSVKRSTFATALEAAEQRLSEVSDEIALYPGETFDQTGVALPNEEYFRSIAPAAMGGAQVPAADAAAAHNAVESAAPEPAGAPATAVAPAPATAAVANASAGNRAPGAQPSEQGEGALAAPAALVAEPPVEVLLPAAAEPEEDLVPAVVLSEHDVVAPGAPVPASAVPVESAAEASVSTAQAPIQATQQQMPAAAAQPEAPASNASSDSTPQPASVSMDYFMAAAVGARAGETVMLQPVSTEGQRQPLTLPDLSATGSIPVVDVQKQRAPLAEAQESGKDAAKSLLTMLPSIDPATPSADDLRVSLPSLSGAIDRVAKTQVFEPVAGATGSFAPVTEALAMEATTEEELFVDDVDDSAFEKDFTETGAYAGPEYVDMPKKRGFGLFDKIFGHKKKEDEASTHEWLDVDDDFDAQEVGASRGSWESFREDDAPAGSEPSESEGFYDDEDYDDGYADYDTYDSAFDDAPQNFALVGDNASEQGKYEDDFDFEYDDNDFSTFFDDKENTAWKGGAFSAKLSGLASGVAGAASRAREALPGGKDESAGAREGRRGGKSARNNRTSREDSRNQPEQWSQDSAYDAPNSIVDDYRDDYEDERAARASEKEEYDRVYQMIADRYKADETDFSQNSASLSEEYSEAHQRIDDFRAGGLDTEVWFVALGAETDCHAGMEEFIAAHRPDLRGAIVIELDSLGAGTLNTAAKEGILKPAVASSRMRRYAKHASQASGVDVGTVSIPWMESAASTALRRGLQAMHLVGMDGAKPALYAQADDTAENVDPELMDDNARFVVELIKSI